MIRRKFYRKDIDTPRVWCPNKDYTPGSDDLERVECSEPEANLIGSEVEHDVLMGRHTVHAPVLDIDFPARLVPSTTPGHFHLYLDIKMSWPTYRRLLEALADAGVIEEGYAEASIERKNSFVRKPGIKKGDGLPPISDDLF